VKILALDANFDGLSLDCLVLLSRRQANVFVGSSKPVAVSNSNSSTATGLTSSSHRCVSIFLWLRRALCLWPKRL